MQKTVKWTIQTTETNKGMSKLQKDDEVVAELFDNPVEMTEDEMELINEFLDV